MRTQSFPHPWNSPSEIHDTVMGQLFGLKRTGVNFAHVPPGKESFVYYPHQREEGWAYIFSGEAQAGVDDNVFTTRDGDFMTFPTGVTHRLRNCGKNDLVYLYGGGHLNIETIDSPRLGKCILRRGGQVDIVDIHPQRELTPFDAQGEDCVDYVRQEAHYNATHDLPRRPPVPDYPDPEKPSFDHCDDVGRPSGHIGTHRVS